MVSPARMPGLTAWVALLPALALVTACTIVRHGAPGSAENASAQKAAANEAFDAKAFVEANWAGKIEPELIRDAVDVREVVAALKKEQEPAERKYGRRQDETALFNFIVKGREVIKAVNTESAAGYVELALPDPSGTDTVKVQIGPVIKSSAVRDVLSFIHFGDFVNQLDFANISKSINFHVRDQVVTGIKDKALAGKHLVFVGAFSADASGKILVTPVKLSVEE